MNKVSFLWNGIKEKVSKLKDTVPLSLLRFYKNLMKLSSDMWKNTYFVRIKFYFFATAKVKIVKIKRSFINVWRKSVFDIYFTEFGTALTTVLPILFLYCYKYCYSDSRNESGKFDALKSDSTHHFFRIACTKSGSLRFSQFSGCWLILSVYIIISFDFPFVRLFGVR